MQPWTYLDYVKSIASDVEFGMVQRGYSFSEAIGFAHSELALRLEELSGEAPMAIIALAANALHKCDFDALQKDEFFISELRDAIKSDRVAPIICSLPADELHKFKEDVALIVLIFDGF